MLREGKEKRVGGGVGGRERMGWKRVMGCVMGIESEEDVLPAS